jgi:thiamine-monophosphate kinase
MSSARPVSTVADTASGEERIIALFRSLATHPGAFGLMDDAAILTPPDGSDVVLKTDAIVGGVHFFADDPADAVARKALRVNLSDLAAKGAKPAGCLLSLAVARVDEAWLTEFARGLGEDAAQFACPLLGGDTVQTSGPIVVSIAAFGLVPRGRMVMRSGARPGDAVVVTGSIGDAVLGLRLRHEPSAAVRWGLDPAMQAHAAARYLVPQPRNAVAEALRTHASGGMDVSDGLVGDLGKLCRAAGVAADVDLERVPLSDAARAAVAAEPALLATLVTGGDDYEILCTMAPAKVASFRTAAAAAGVAASEIGRVTAGEGARFRHAGKPVSFAHGSYSHL